MKKILLSLLLAFTFLACEGPEGPMGPAGQPGQPGSGTNWSVKTITVTETDWKLMGNPGELNSYYYADKSLSELTKSVYQDGAVIGYIEVDNGVKNGLPFVSHWGESDNAGEYLWTETYDFDYYIGGLRFYLTYSDFNTQIKPKKRTFHVVLMR